MMYEVKDQGLGEVQYQVRDQGQDKEKDQGQG